MHKLTTKQLIQLNNSVYDSIKEKKYDSIGKAIYHELLAMCQYWADKVKHTEHDPFHDDKNIFKCLFHISEPRAMQYYLTHMNHCFGEKYHQPSVIDGYPIFI